MALSSKSSIKIRAIYGVYLLVTLYVIGESNSQQGFLVMISGVAVAFAIYLNTKSKTLTIGYLAASFIGFIALILGTQDKGPFSFLYKTSVSLRGDYWRAGWNMTLDNPILGVGMDSYGDWYRRSRDLETVSGGDYDRTANAAHNVFLDISAGGGFPLVLIYLAIAVLVVVSALRVITREKEFNPLFAGFVGAWVAFQAQSIISINQIGLAIWGWLLSGLLIAYERSNRLGLQERNQQSGQQKKKLAPASVQPKLIVASSVGAVVGLLIALPPLASDTKWRSAQLDRTLPSLEASLQPGYFNPHNSNKFLANIQILESSNLPDLAREYALEAVKWNPEDFNLWKMLYLIQKSTPAEKNTALLNMKRLDPLNPDVTSTQ
jgi:hypothetical protein